MAKKKDNVIDDSEILKVHQEFNEFVDNLIDETVDEILKEKEKQEKQKQE